MTASMWWCAVELRRFTWISGLQKSKQAYTQSCVFETCQSLETHSVQETCLTLSVSRFVAFHSLGIRTVTILRAEYVHKKQGFYAIEQPSSSLLWYYPPLEAH